MEFSDLKLSLLSVQRSTTITYQFHELRESNSDLVEDAEVELVDSGLEQLKQMLQCSCMIEWMNVCDLILHDLARISNCHGWMQASSCFKSEWIVMVLASNMRHNPSRWWFDQWMMNWFEENCKSLREKVWRKISDLKMWWCWCSFLLWLAIYMSS